MNPPSSRSWELYASARATETGEELAFFGREGFARQDALAHRIVRVHLAVTDDPAPEDYWAWLDDNAHEPCHIGANEAVMTRGFLADQPNAPGPREEQDLGQGQILRLRVAVVEEVCRRSGRRNWRPRISSAM